MWTHKALSVGIRGQGFIAKLTLKPTFCWRNTLQYKAMGLTKHWNNPCSFCWLKEKSVLYFLYLEFTIFVRVQTDPPLLYIISVLDLLDLKDQIKTCFHSTLWESKKIIMKNNFFVQLKKGHAVTASVSWSEYNNRSLFQSIHLSGRLWTFFISSYFSAIS